MSLNQVFHILINKLTISITYIIEKGGYNVYPREIEDALRQHESIHDIAVVGVPDKEFGELVVGIYINEHLRIISNLCTFHSIR